MTKNMTRKTTPVEMLLADGMRREAERRLTEEVSEVLRSPAEKQHVWMGSKADLYEAVYVAWDTMTLHDPTTGRRLQLRQAMSGVCRRLLVDPPANPSSVARKARQRKGVRAESFLVHYQYCIEQGMQRPLHHLIH